MPLLLLFPRPFLLAFCRVLVPVVLVAAEKTPTLAVENNAANESCEAEVAPFYSSLREFRGIIPLVLRDAAAAATLQPDGKIIVAGTADYAIALARYNPNGSLDLTFGAGGIVTTRISTDTSFQSNISPQLVDVVSSVALQPDGKVVVAGSTANAREYRFFVARFTPSGRLDTSFENNGKMLPRFGRGGAILTTLPDRKLLAVMGSVGPYSLVRLHSDGQVDTDFGIDGAMGIARQTFPLTDPFLTKFLPGRSSLISGYRAGPWQPELAVLCYSPYEQVASYLPLGAQPGDNVEGGIFSIIEKSFSLQAVAPQANKKIVAGGFAPYPDPMNEDFVLTRYNIDGTVDTTFGGGEKVSLATNSLFSEHELKGPYFNLPYSCRGFCQVAVQKDGKIVAAGSPWQQHLVLFRYNPDGSLDSSFGVGGKVITAVGSAGDVMGSLALQKDDKIVLAGACKNARHTNFSVIRYNPDGSLDSTFAGDGKVTTRIGLGIPDLDSIPKRALSGL